MEPNGWSDCQFSSICMKNILTFLLCNATAFILSMIGAFLGHHYGMVVLEQIAHVFLIELAICSILGTICLLSILTLQLVKICSGFRMWSGKYKTYLTSIEKEADRIKKQKEAIENGK